MLVKIKEQVAWTRGLLSSQVPPLKQGSELADDVK